MVMTDIETKRLHLHVKTFGELEQGMNEGDEMSVDFYHAYQYHSERIPGYDTEWFRLWDFYLKGTTKRIGGACFKGQPDKDGQVEIGYGIDEEYQNRGYATEAIAALVNMAIRYPGVQAVLFEIEKTNGPSKRVAEKLEARLVEEREGNLWYRVEKITKNA